MSAMNTRTADTRIGIHKAKSPTIVYLEEVGEGAAGDTLAHNVIWWPQLDCLVVCQQSESDY